MGKTPPTPTEELREVIREGRALLKDLNIAVREAREATAQAVSKDLVQQRIDIAVSEGLSEYEATVKQAMSDAVNKVQREFEKLTNLMLTGKQSGKGQSLVDIAIEKGMPRDV